MISSIVNINLSEFDSVESHDGIVELKIDFESVIFSTEALTCCRFKDPKSLDINVSNLERIIRAFEFGPKLVLLEVDEFASEAKQIIGDLNIDGLRIVQCEFSSSPMDRLTFLDIVFHYDHELGFEFLDLTERIAQIKTSHKFIVTEGNRKENGGYTSAEFSTAKVRLPLEFKTKQATGDLPEIFDWNRTIQQLATDSTETKAWFPNVAEFWNEVRTESPIDAVRTIENIRKSSKDSLTLMGLKVPKKHLAIGIGCTLLFVSTFFCLHMNNAKRLIEAGEVVPAGFPWIALFSDPVSRLITFCSMYVLPVFSLFVFTVRMGSSWATIVLWLTTSVSIFFLFLFNQNLERMRSGSSNNHRADGLENRSGQLIVNCLGFLRRLSRQIRQRFQLKS